METDSAKYRPLQDLNPGIGMQSRKAQQRKSQIVPSSEAKFPGRVANIEPGQPGKNLDSKLRTTPLNRERTRAVTSNFFLIGQISRKKLISMQTRMTANKYLFFLWVVSSRSYCSSWKRIAACEQLGNYGKMDSLDVDEDVNVVVGTKSSLGC